MNICEYCEVLKNLYFEEHQQTAACDICTWTTRCHLFTRKQTHLIVKSNPEQIQYFLLKYQLSRLHILGILLFKLVTFKYSFYPFSSIAQVSFKCIRKERQVYLNFLFAFCCHECPQKYSNYFNKNETVFYKIANAEKVIDARKSLETVVMKKFFAKENRKTIKRKITGKSSEKCILFKNIK